MAGDQAAASSALGFIQQAEPTLTPSNKRMFESDSNSAYDSANNVPEGFLARDVKKHQTLNLQTVMNGSEENKQEDQSYNQFNEEKAAEPCKSVVVRNIPDEATSADVAFLFSPFSSQTVNVTFLSSGEALVELEDSATAERAVEYFNAYCVAIKGVPITAMLASLSDRAVFDSDLSSSSSGHSLTKQRIDPTNLRVLLVTISEIRYPVDIELLQRLFCTYGQLEKIITFRKAANRYQALIQFSNPRGVRDATHHLNNKCIFDGCNKMQIQTSKLTQLIVKQNNEKSWDFTVAPFPVKPKLSDAVRNTSMSTFNGGSPAGGYGNISSQGVLMSSPMQAGKPHQAPSYQFLPADNGMSASHYGSPQRPYGISSVNASQPNMGFSSANQQFINPEWFEKLPREIQQNPDILHRLNAMQSCVVICYNLPVEEMTVTKLFNLLSLYGAVLRIKFLRDKPDTALAQFSHPLFATLACYYLANAPLFGSQNSDLQIRMSNKTEVKLPRTEGAGADKETLESAIKRTVSFQPSDQRARPDEVEKFLRSGCKPTNTLFIANVNESVDELRLKELLSTIGTVTKIELGPAKQPSKRLTAMVEMASERLALTAVCHLHNHQLAGFNLKVAFSKRILKDGNN